MHDRVNQTTSSWIGFDIKIRDTAAVKLDKVDYLPTINALATNVSNVQEILSQSVAI